MRVQIYNSLSRFLIKSEDFLLENEVVNNLFWEVLVESKKKKKVNQWAGNVMKEGKIELSAIRTASNYLLISAGSVSAVQHLTNYAKRKKWNIKGVSGPAKCSLFFSKEWLNGSDDQPAGRKNFSIYETSGATRYLKDEKQFLIKRVGKNEWPKARLWAMQFAIESTPKLNATAIVNMARNMMQTGNLFFFQKQGFNSCGMAGFGRKTKNFQVINLVYIPKEERGKKYAQKMISKILYETKDMYSKKHLLFSDYKREENLYEKAGFQFKSEYCERMFY